MRILSIRQSFAVLPELKKICRIIGRGAFCSESRGGYRELCNCTPLESVIILALNGNPALLFLTTKDRNTFSMHQPPALRISAKMRLRTLATGRPLPSISRFMRASTTDNSSNTQLPATRNTCVIQLFFQIVSETVDVDGVEDVSVSASIYLTHIDFKIGVLIVQSKTMLRSGNL